ncbi:unnamed protein product [Urochloa decumbens]|uniref:Uncharacterized protein n=1 Tax=Urochloa decumbens TaxID=240449 RepID=A0ABC8Z778_9POAL
MMSPPRLLATAMAAHLPHLPALLFVFLAVHVPASHGNAALLPTTYDASMCHSSMCGSVNITYPFYLASARKETTDYSETYSCGYTDLEISCEVEGRNGAPVPVIQLGDDKYTVLNISYNSSTIVLADSDVLGPAPCPEPHHNVTFDYKWLQYNTSNYDYENLTFFFDCYSKIGDSVPPGLHKDYQINCTRLPSPPDGFVFSAEELGIGIAQDYELASHCKEIVTVPVQREALKGNVPYMLATGDYVDVLKMGFELEWNRVTEEKDQCYLCEGSGGRCTYGQSRAFLGCLCSGGKVGNPDCKSKSSVLSWHSSTMSRWFFLGFLSPALIICTFFFLPSPSRLVPHVCSFPPARTWFAQFRS